MLVFLGWSGAESKEVALTLKKWLPQMVNALEPWISDDVTKGTRWGAEITARLNKSKAGIFCLTPENLTAPWINFEAGALSNVEALACTFLVRLVPGNVTGPLREFQHTLASDKEDTWKLVHDLQAHRPASDGPMLAEDRLRVSFEKFWPDLAGDLEGIPPASAAAPPEPSQQEILAEILETVREMAQRDRTRRLEDAIRRGPMIKAAEQSRALLRDALGNELYVIRTEQLNPMQDFVFQLRKAQAESPVDFKDLERGLRGEDSKSKE